MMRTWASMALGLLAAVPSLFGFTAASAVECLQPPERDDARVREAADVNFVGTVESVSDMNRVAHVKIEEVKKGPLQPNRVEVQGFVNGAYTSADRLFEVGQRYVFFPRKPSDAGGAARDPSKPFRNDGGPFKEDACTATYQIDDQGRRFVDQREQELKPGAAGGLAPPPGDSNSTGTKSSNGGLLVATGLGFVVMTAAVSLIIYRHRCTSISQHNRKAGDQAQEGSAL